MTCLACVQGHAGVGAVIGEIEVGPNVELRIWVYGRRKEGGLFGRSLLLEIVERRGCRGRIGRVWFRTNVMLLISFVLTLNVRHKVEGEKTKTFKKLVVSQAIDLYRANEEVYQQTSLRTP